MEKSLLLIDDSKDHIGVLDNIKNHLYRNETISLTTKYINPNDRKYLDEELDPDIDKLINGIKNKLFSIKPNLIVVDQYYSGNEKYKGIDVIENLRNIPKFKKCSIFLISGKRDKIVKEIFSNEKITDSDKVKQLAKLINLKITSFLDKDFKDEAINILKQLKIEEILPTKLRSYEGDNAIINKFSPCYSTITFSELADKIENSHPESITILDEIFDLTISHYVKINEKL